MAVRMPSKIAMQQTKFPRHVLKGLLSYVALVCHFRDIKFYESLMNRFKANDSPIRVLLLFVDLVLYIRVYLLALAYFE